MRRALVAGVAGALALASCAQLKQLQDRTGIRVNDPREQVAGTRACKNLLEREVPWEEERDLGGVLTLALAQRGGGFPNAPLAGAPGRPDASPADQQALALARVGRLVASFSARPDIPWTFGVVPSRSANAFSAPGGYILVTQGLLDRMDNESQLAGVLAHEVGHVALRHAVNVYRVSKHGQCLAEKANDATFGSVDVKVNASRAGQGKKLFNIGAYSQKLVSKFLDPLIDDLVNKGFGQSDELEADAVATDLLVMAGYDPREYQRLLLALPNEKGVYPNHPTGKARSAKVDERLKGQWTGFAWEQNPKVALEPALAAGKSAASTAGKP